MIWIAPKLAAVSLTAVLGVTAADVCTCPPPETETISCIGGQASWAGARCTEAVAGRWLTITLQCPPEETAISGGYRWNPLGLPVPRRRPLTAAPLAPSGGHARGYQYVYRIGRELTPPDQEYKVYVTCQRV